MAEDETNAGEAPGSVDVPFADGSSWIDADSRSLNEIWDALRAVGHETGVTVSLPEHLQGVFPTDEREQILLILRAQRQLLTAPEPPKHSKDTAPYNRYEVLRKEYLVTLRKTLAGLETEWLASLDATRTRELGSTLDFSAIADLRGRMAERLKCMSQPEFVKASTVDELDTSVRHSAARYVYGLELIMAFPETEEERTPAVQTGVAERARHEFQEALKGSEALVQTQSLRTMETMLAGYRERMEEMAALREEVLRVQETMEALPAAIVRLDALEASARAGDDALSDATMLLERLRGIEKEANDHANDAIATIDGLLESTRYKATQVTVAEHAATWGTQADSNRKWSWLWFGLTVGFGCAVFGATFWAFGRSFLGATDTSTRGLVSDVVVRGAAISVLFSLFQLSRRLFYAQGHLAEVNRHRQRSLESFDRFYEQAKEHATKDAVLAAATRAVFDQTQTGFLGRAEAPKPSGPFGDLVKNIFSLAPKDG